METVSQGADNTGEHGVGVQIDNEFQVQDWTEMETCKFLYKTHANVLFPLPPSTAVPMTTPTLEFCGDGVVNNAGAEECDDGNTDSLDGCNASCAVEFCGDGV
eukprot:2408611-Rhodomonas_salina.2